MRMTMLHRVTLWKSAACDVGGAGGDSRASGWAAVMDRTHGSCCRVGDGDETKRTVLTRVYCWFMFSNKCLTSEQPADPRVASYREETGAHWEGAGQQHFEGCSTD